MIGGTVVDVWKFSTDYVSVVVREDDKCLCVRLEKTTKSICIGHGDTLWWQSDIALWTSKDRSLMDEHIQRIGNSFAVTDCICPERIEWNKARSQRTSEREEWKWD